MNANRSPRSPRRPGRRLGPLLVKLGVEPGYELLDGADLGDPLVQGLLVMPGDPVVVVTAGGLDRPYPSAHTALFERVIDVGGLLVSQYPLGAAPLSVRFRRRSALVAALSAAVVVVEAAARSGALSAVYAAQAIGRPVFVVPGPVTSACSVGCHVLLTSGEARLVTAAADVLSALTARSA